MSTLSKKLKTEGSEDKNSNVLSKFFKDMKTDKKAVDLSKKASRSFCLKKGDSIKVTKNNFYEVLTNLAYMTLNKNEQSGELLNSIGKFIKSASETKMNQDSELLLRVSYKKDSLSMEPLRTIEKQIANQLFRSKNSIYLMVYELWYSYMFAKYNTANLADRRKAMSNFHNDITIFGEYISNIIYHLFYEWFFVHQKKIDMYGKIIKELVPNLLTQHKEWAKIYKKILECFGEKPFKFISKSKPEQVIFLKAEFSGEGVKEPFRSCVDVMKQIYEESIPKRKIAKIKELILTVKQEMRRYQDFRIQEGKMKEYEEMDADNIVALYAYCILMSEQPGVGESIEYLELFYGDDKTEAKFLQEAGIEHTMASIRSAAQYLHMEDDMLQTK